MNKDVVLKILSLCDIKTIVRFSQCCQEIYRFSNDTNLWLKLCEDNSFDQYNDLIDNNNQKLFILCYQLTKLKKAINYLGTIDKLYSKNVINACYHRLEKVPVQIQCLTYLKELDLSNNNTFI